MNEEFQFFRNRREAGLRLAGRLAHLKERQPVVLALPRGGVPVAFEIALALDAPLDVVLVRKLGAPLQPELAIGAVVEGAPPEVVMGEEVASARASSSYISAEIARQTKEIARRRTLYARPGGPVPVKGRTVIVVDDGIATGATMRAALLAVRRREPAWLVVAAPVAAADTASMLAREADEAVYLIVSERMGAIGLFYEDFRQLEDEEVSDLLRASAREAGAVGEMTKGA